jgi:hypothetical protein
MSEEPKKVRLRYTVTTHGRDFRGNVTGHVYTGLPPSTGQDVIEVDERDVSGLLALRRNGCCGRRPQPFFVLA